MRPASRRPSVLLRAFAGLAVVAAALTVPAVPASANGGPCAVPAFSGGSGTAASPYLIATTADLVTLADDTTTWACDFRQIADIGISGIANWTPIGDDTTPFSGTYRGNDFTTGGSYTISGLRITGTPTGPAGLFGLVESVDDTVVIENLDLTGVNITTERNIPEPVGALAGSALGTDDTPVQVLRIGVELTEVLGGDGPVGGLVGDVDQAELASVHVVGGPITGSLEAGGIAGILTDSTVTHSSTRTSLVQGLTQVGGIAGCASGVVLERVLTTGPVLGVDDAVGGLVGCGTDLAISDSFVTGAVSGDEAVGGLVGALASSGPASTITHSYAAGRVTGSVVAGGLVGLDDDSTVATAAYWDTQATGQAASPVGDGRTTAQMQTLSTFGSWSIRAGWSPAAVETWGICQAPANPSYPFLQQQQAIDPCFVPPPPPVFPPSAPRDVVALAGDASAEASWKVPASSGTFAITNYQVSSLPGNRSCLVSAPALSCSITGLTNGTLYTFSVRALSGAGWGPWSAVSNAVTPEQPVVPTIVISGSRGTGADSRTVRVDGLAMGLVGSTVQARVRLAGQSGFAFGSVRVIGEDEVFAWQRRAGKRIDVFFEAAGLESNRVSIPGR